MDESTSPIPRQPGSAPAGVEISFPTSGQRPGVRYVSDTTVLEEALEHGRLIGLYWSAAGQVQRENVTTGLPGLDSLRYPLHVFELEMDGQSLHNRWDWVGGSRRPGPRPGTAEAVVELRHQVRPVSVRVVTRLDGSPILARYLEITNTGQAPAALAAVSPSSGVLWNTHTERPFHHTHANPSFDGGAEGKFALGYFANEEPLMEGDFVWRPLPPEGFRVERKASGRSWGWPYCIVRNRVTGELFFLGLGWGGNFFAEFTHRPDALLSFRLGPLAPAPLRIVAPGETVTSPEVHLGPLHGSMDEAVGQWHRHIRASVVPPRPEGREMFTVAGRVVEEPGDWILREIDIAAEMGVEAFMVDAGWYGATFGGWPELRGDWREGPWLPGGLAGIRRHAHEKGLLFGLWHEPECVSSKSRLAQDHPDWVLTTDDRRPCAEALDLANPQAGRFLEETVLRLIGEHELDFYKLDYNVSPREGGQTLRDGYAESEFWRHHEVLYRTYDRVRREFPRVCLENCAGGGGRNDLGMLSRFHYLCESDWSVMPYSIRALNALSLFVPPEAIAYYHNHVNWIGVLQAHQLADADTHLRVTLFAVPIYVGFGAQNADRSTEFYRKTRRYIDLHKGFCRPVLAEHPIVYHHTPDIGLFAPAQWCVLEYARPDRARGYAGVFRLADGEGEYRLRLRGVERGGRYEVTLDNSGQTFAAEGQSLAEEGLTIRLDAALTSELVLYRRMES
ncbi:MAG TPA: glycoside hydrolase family 36 protein [Phycisphaerae bacterium]|nr:glycoside hydrolase family 36 protein [Phycisphaerae bacterium]